MSPSGLPGPRDKAPGRRGGHFRLFFTIVVTALAVYFLWRVLSDVGLHALASRLRDADLLLIASAVILTVLRFLLLAVRWEVLARREAPVGLGQIVPVLMAGNFLALVTPAVRIAGPILRAYYLSKETGRPRARFYGTIVADQTANLTIFAVVAAVTGAMVGMRRGFGISIAAGAGMLCALCGGLWLGYVMLRRVHQGHPSEIGRALKRMLGEGPPGGWRRRFVAWWEDLVKALSGAVVSSGAWWPALALSAAAYAVGIAIQVLAFAAVGSHVSAVQVAFGIAAAGSVQIAAAAPGGPGVTEATLIGAFLAIGIDRESAVAGVLLGRLANYLVLLPWGCHAMVSLQRRYGRPRNGEAG